MKLSIRWLFEHIEASWQSCDVEALVKRFIETTAEVEEVHALTLDQNSFAIGQVTSVLASEVRLTVPEWKKEYTVSARSGAHVGECYLLFCQSPTETIRWATLSDLGSGKDGLAPAVFVDDKDLAGAWKKQIAWTDTILVVDNKSITHRPDMWGHRGFAREVAALLDLPLKPLDTVCTPLATVGKGTEYKAPQGDMSVAITSPACSRFATLSLHNVSARPSLVAPLFMLARVDARPIDALVDLTNYVMLDIGQPTHAFDAAKLTGSTFGPRAARKGEELTLLDGQKITLNSDDLVIADGQKPVALAGVMGGADSGVSAATREVVIESANFDAATIRRTALAHKVRTEASARFEKTLDPNLNVLALERAAKLCVAWQLPVTVAPHIVSLGEPAQPGHIAITHAFIEARLGTSLTTEFVLSTLVKREFGVEHVMIDGMHGYDIIVPTFRSTKDVRIPEDIVEEIGRAFGYTSIRPVAPMVPVVVRDTHERMARGTIKRVMSSGLSMREIYSYGLFDEAFLRELGYEPEHTVDIKNPVSEQWRRLVTSLLPALFKAVRDNQMHHDTLRFFELARVWRQERDITEKRSLAAIFYDKHAKLTFYDAKAELQKLFVTLALPVAWERVDCPEQPWYTPHQTAKIMAGDIVVGTFGMVHPSYMALLGEGVAAVCELDGEFLLAYQAPVKRFVPLSKFPSTSRDVSLLVPLALQAASVHDEIKHADKRITAVILVDFFEKAEWTDKRSLTFRYVMQGAAKTLTKEEADAIEQTVLKRLVALGATVR